MDYQKKINELFAAQKDSWPLLKTNLQGLKSAKLRKFDFDGFTFHVQFNPERIKSSAAKVDKVSIENRACFLCAENRPAEQLGVDYKDYEFLCNPYPIFNQHYTIVKKEHVPQAIRNEFSAMLEISRSLPDLVLFYNGPECGASAPDHMHFQAGNKGFLPIENELKHIETAYGEVILDNDVIKIQAVSDSTRKFISLESDDRDSLQKAFSVLYNYLDTEEGKEHMMNILSWFEGKWKILIFLRALHRPWQYFEDGDKNILLSPASVDLGGTLITPLEKDFEKISKADMSDILNQVSISPEKFKELKEFLLKHLKF
jgi:ATP adenylyltransferase/5',5'''-P-1,P-4-tetraphosphate phosphorylase II